MRRRVLKEYGQTPWDKLTKKQLLREVQRMYSAVNSARGALHCMEQNEPYSPYWKPTGTGGTALAKCEQIVNDIEARFDGENVYRAFFRYADDLLFDTTGRGSGIGFKWVKCPVCGEMVGSYEPEKSHIGKQCQDVIAWKEGCPGILRKIEWQDLYPQQKEEEA